MSQPINYQDDSGVDINDLAEELMLAEDDFLSLVVEETDLGKDSPTPTQTSKRLGVVEKTNTTTLQATEDIDSHKQHELTAFEDLIPVSHQPSVDGGSGRRGGSRSKSSSPVPGKEGSSRVRSTSRTGNSTANGAVSSSSGSGKIRASTSANNSGKTSLFDKVSYGPYTIKKEDAANPSGNNTANGNNGTNPNNIPSAIVLATSVGGKRRISIDKATPSSSGATGSTAVAASTPNAISMKTVYERLIGKTPMSAAAESNKPLGPSMVSTLGSWFSKESAEERTIRNQLKVYIKRLQNELQYIARAVVKHRKRVMEQIQDFEKQEKQLIAWGLKAALPKFHLQAWYRLARCHLLEEFCKELDSLLNTKQKKVMVYLQQFEETSKQDRLSKFSLSGIETFCANIDALMIQDISILMFSERLKQFDVLCSLTTKQFIAMEPQFAWRDHKQRRKALYRILQSYNNLPKLSELTNIETDLSWSTFCKWVAVRIQRLKLIEQDFSDFIEDQREMEGRLFFRWYTSVMLMVNKGKDHKMSSTMPNAANSNNNHEYDPYEGNHPTNTPVTTSSSTAHHSNTAKDMMDANGQLTLAALKVTPTSIKAFVRYFATDVVGVKYSIPKDFVNANIALTEALFYRRISSYVFRYIDKVHKDKDDYLRLHVQKCRYVDPALYHVPEEYYVPREIREKYPKKEHRLFKVKSGYREDFNLMTQAVQNSQKSAPSSPIRRGSSQSNPGADGTSPGPSMILSYAPATPHPVVSEEEEDIDIEAELEKEDRVVSNIRQSESALTPMMRNSISSSNLAARAISVDHFNSTAVNNTISQRELLAKALPPTPMSTLMKSQAVGGLNMSTFIATGASSSAKHNNSTPHEISSSKAEMESANLLSPINSPMVNSQKHVDSDIKTPPNVDAKAISSSASTSIKSANTTPRPNSSVTIQSTTTNGSKGLQYHGTTCTCEYCQTFSMSLRLMKLPSFHLLPDIKKMLSIYQMTGMEKINTTSVFHYLYDIPEDVNIKPANNASFQHYGAAYARSSRVLSWLSTAVTPREMIFYLTLACKWILRDAIDVSGKLLFKRISSTSVLYSNCCFLFLLIVGSRSIIGADLMVPLFTLVLIYSEIPNLHMLLYLLLHYGDYDDQGDVSYNMANLEGSLMFVMSMEIPPYLDELFEQTIVQHSIYDCVLKTQSKETQAALQASNGSAPILIPDSENNSLLHQQQQQQQLGTSPAPSGSPSGSNNYISKSPMKPNSLASSLPSTPAVGHRSISGISASIPVQKLAFDKYTLAQPIPRPTELNQDDIQAMEELGKMANSELCLNMKLNIV